MAFSASPLVPGQETENDVWRRIAASVVAATKAALPQIPNPDPLSVGEPVGDPAAAQLPTPAGAAVTGYLGGGAEGKILLVVGQELVTALEGTPFGDLQPAQALKPALEAIAQAMGGRLEGDADAVPVQDCLEVLNGGVPVLLPLTAGGTVAALVGISVTGASAQPSAGGGPSAAANAASAARSWGIDMLRDVSMEVTCELGRTRMTVRQLLALAPGDVVELDRLAGAPADLLVNGTLLARGEVVVIDESFGLRITEIVSKDAS